MTPKEYSYQLYERYYKGYMIILKDIFSARKLAKECAISDAQEMMLLAKEEISLVNFYSNVLIILKNI